MMNAIEIVSINVDAVTIFQLRYIDSGNTVTHLFWLNDFNYYSIDRIIQIIVLLKNSFFHIFFRKFAKKCFVRTRNCPKILRKSRLSTFRKYCRKIFEEVINKMVISEFYKEGVFFIIIYIPNISFNSFLWFKFI